MSLKKIRYNELSDYIICLANSSGDVVTNLKLQKLMYYTQAFHLTAFGEAFFDGKFEAWVHGPVLRRLYSDYHDVGFQPIFKEIDERYLNEFESSLNPKQKKLIEEVIGFYSGMSGYQLEKLTHSEKPWIEARNGLPEDAPSQNLISEDTMREFYKQYWIED